MLVDIGMEARCQEFNGWRRKRIIVGEFNRQFVFKRLVDRPSAFPNGDNLIKWTATIVGGKGTVYETLEYKLSIEFPDNYPFSAPTVKFLTPCFHPNVDQHGNICLDILKDQWSAIYNVKTVLISIQSLLGDPNNDSPLNSTAASLWEDQQHYKMFLLKHYNEQKVTVKNY